MDVFLSALDGYPIQSGFILIGLGIIGLLFQLDLKEPLKMKDHSYFSWKVFINKWFLIIMAFIWGLTLILKNI
ncbi:hypothetical protein [Polaribacter aquimarinus]|uniref:Uncharacterized protein n=1 Tax=Polaribacter aquimarinus TaxID=2100726 RepID=A0A2U2JBK2_9FLAO|nr:hypothetical protein [Polaribacter aquimarinus]PWG05685.1 hypothetical protein DIS07_04365 [Polaribacter aquimarinus]